MEGAADLIDYLMRLDNLLIVAAVWVLISVVNRCFPRMRQTKAYARLAPALPVLLCSAAVWVPGAADPNLGIGSRIFLGIVLGAVVANAHKLLGQTVLGRDARISGMSE